MPYYKSKYRNGAIIAMNKTEQAIMPPNKYNQVNKAITNTIQSIKPANSTAGFTGFQYRYYPSTQNKTQQTTSLANYNDPLEINSIRDIILGSSNKHLKHTLNTDSAALNIVADTIMHSYNHFIKPTFKGEFNVTTLNLLSELGEDLDFIANPVKAAIIAVANNEDVGKAVKRATVGDETGIYNYEYDTGNGITDLILEVVSDPLNWVSLSGKTLVKKGINSMTDIALKGASEFTQTGIKELAQEISEKTGKQISTTVLNTLILDAQKEASTKVLKRQVINNASDIVRTKKILGSNIADEILKSSNAKFTKKFTKNLNSIVDVSSLDEAAFKGLYEGIEKLNKNILTKNAADITSSLGIKMVALEDDISRTILKGGLSISGIYPAYSVLKKTNLQTYFDNKIIRRATQNKANEVIHPKESFVKATDYDGVMQTIQEDINLKNILPDKYKDVEFIPEREASLVAQQIALRIYEAQGDFKAGIKKPQALKRSILNRLQSIDSHTKFENIEQVYEYIEKLEQRYFKAVKDNIVNTEFTSIKQALQNLINDYNKLDMVDTIDKDLLQSKYTTEFSQEILSFTDSFKKYKLKKKLPDTYSVNKVLNKIPFTEYINNVNILAKSNINTITDNTLLNLYGIISNLKVNNEDLMGGIGLLKDMLEDYFESKDPSELLEILKLIKEFRINYLKDPEVLRRLIPQTLQDSLFPINEVTGIKELNQPLIDTLKSAIYNTEYPNDFTKTQVYNEASKVVELTTERNKRIDALTKELVDIKDLNKTYLKIVKNNITEISKLNDENLLKTNITLGKSHTNILAFTNHLTDEEGVFNPKKLYSLFENLNKNKFQLIDMHPLLEDSIEQIFEYVYSDLQSYIRITNILNDSKKITDFKAYYYELARAHKRLKSSINSIHRLTDPVNPFDINIATKYREGIAPTGLSIIDKIEEEVLDVLSPEIYDSKFLQLNNDNYYVRLQLEKTQIQHRFNNLKTLDIIKQDIPTQNLINTIINCKSSAKLKALFEEQGLNEATQSALTHLAVLQQDITNSNKATVMFDSFVDTLKVSSEQKNKIRTAIHTSLDYAKRKDLLKTDAQLLTDELVKNVQGYVYGSDLTSKKQDLDTLLNNIALKEGRTINEIEEDIVKLINTISGIDPSTVTRHSALYDTVAQIYTYEKTTGETFIGNMLDIESTKLLNKQDQSNGLITEITVVNKDINGTLTVPFNKRIQVTQDTLENKYMQTIPYLKKLEIAKGITLEEHQAKYLANADTVLEDNLLAEFSEWIRSLPSKTNLSTFNGDDFDLRMLDNRFKATLKKYDFTDVLNNLSVKDFFKELSKDRFRFTQQNINSIYNIFDQIIINQRNTLGKYRLMMDYPIKVIGGVDRRFIDTAKQFLDLDTLNRLDLGTSGDFFLNTLAEVDEDSTLDILETLLTKANKAKVKEDIFSSISDPTIRKYMYDLLQEYIEEARAVGRENQAFKDIIIPGDLFDSTKRSRIQEDMLREIQNELIEAIPDENYKAYLKANAGLATNLTQLLSLGVNGDPMYAYKKFDGTILNLWDQRTVALNANTLDNVYRKLNKIINTNDKLYNVDSIIPFKQDIYNMIQDIQAKGLTDLSKALVIDTHNLQFAYSELDTLWDELKTQAITSKINTITPQKLIEELATKYEDLVQLLEDGTPFVKVSTNTHNIEFITPRTARWNRTLNNNLFSNFKEFKNTVDKNLTNLNNFLNAMDSKTNTNIFNIKNNTTNLLTDFNIFKRNINDFIVNLENILEDSNLKILKNDKDIQDSILEFKTLKSEIQKIINNIKKIEDIINEESERLSKSAQGTKIAKELRIPEYWMSRAYKELTNLKKSMKDENRIFRSFLSKNKQEKYIKLLEPFKDFDFIHDKHSAYEKLLNKETSQTYNELIALKDLSNRTSRKIDALTNTNSGILEITKESRTAGVLHQKLIDMRLTNKDRKVSNNFRAAGISTTHLRLGWATHNTLNSTPKQLVSEIINANKHHVKIINKPKDNKYFNNLDKFNELLSKEKELKKVGIKMMYDESTEKLYLGIDSNKFKITLNKNNFDGARYCINGEPVIPNTFETIPYDVFMSYISGPKEYVDTLYEWFSKLEIMQPELKGRFGITNYREGYDKATDLGVFDKLSTALNEDDYMPFLNDSFLGNFDAVQRDVGPMYSDALYLFSNTSSKITTQLAKHLEYGQFIMDTGISFNSEIIKKLDSKELNDWLNVNPDYVAVYLADAKRANGGFELRRINRFNDTTMKEAQRLNAVIIPYQQYIRSAEQINNYHYNNNFERIMGKITNAYKAGWLSFSPGLIIRNVIDSAMKNYIEGESIPEISMKYIQAFDLYHKYTKVMHDIQQMDSNKRYTFENAKTYFKRKDTLLDSETYHFIYNFMNENGMNTLKTGNTDIYGWAMKPMGYTEKINRLVQYLNLSEQGMNYDTIIRHIAETHFDYSTKTQFDFVTQLYIPFWTYASNNITYVANLIDKHPSFLRNYFNVYQSIWDFDELNYEELAQNVSLQNQILSGNIPLKLFGYQDKEVTRIVQTKYGPKEQVATNTAVLKMGSSILDGLNFFTNPYNYVKEKLAPPMQVVIDTISDFTDSALGNSEKYKWTSKEDAEKDYMRNFGSTSVQAIFEDPSKIMQLASGFTALIPNDNVRTLASAGINMFNRFNQSKVEERTDNKLLASIPSIFGATSRWGEFKNESRKTYSYPSYSKTYSKTYTSAPRYNRYYSYNFNRNYPMSYRVNHKGQSVKYYLRYPQRTYYTGKTPYTAYSNMVRRIYSPNTAHRFVSNNINSNMQTIPQYLYSYYGKNRQGRSKILSWMRMSSKYKVKSTLRRIASP